MVEEFKSLISTYVKAKDSSKPYLMSLAFSTDAALKMTVKTDSISFPSEVVGVEEITDVLVRKFNNTYENIYTICLSDTIELNGNELKCRWLVGMTDKETDDVRVGYGDYIWSFSNVAPVKVKNLEITIDEMQVLPKHSLSIVQTLFESLPYPWAATTAIVESSCLVEPLFFIQRAFKD